MNKHNNKQMPVRTLTMAAIFAALITVLTTLSFPIPGGYGYIHAGDSMIYACAWALGGPVAGFAAAIGSALADILLGWAQYAPATAVIKFLMAFVSYALMKTFSYKPLTNIFAMAIGAAIMVGGYFAYDNLLYGIGGAVGALGSNLIQAAAGVVLGTAIITVMDNVKAFDPFVRWKAAKKNEQD